MLRCETYGTCPCPDSDLHLWPQQPPLRMRHRSRRLEAAHAIEGRCRSIVLLHPRNGPKHPAPPIRIHPCISYIGYAKGKPPLTRYAGAFLIRPRVPSWAFQGISFQQSGGWNPCRTQVCIRCSPVLDFHTLVLLPFRNGCAPPKGKAQDHIENDVGYISVTRRGGTSRPEIYRFSHVRNV